MPNIPAALDKGYSMNASEARGRFVQVASSSLAYSRARMANTNKRPSNWTERALLALIMAVIPVQSNLGTWHGISVVFIVFGIILLHQLFWRPNSVWRSIRHPIMIAAYIFVVAITAIEFAHGNAALGYIFRICFMLVGAVTIASQCLDLKAVMAGIYGYITGSCIVAIGLLIAAGSGLDFSAASKDFYEMSVIRGNTFAGSLLRDNLNALAFYAAQGAVLTCAIALTARERRNRFLSITIGVACAAATCLSLSRGGMVLLAFGLLCMLRAYGILKPRVLVAVGFCAIVLMIFMPDIVARRLTFSTEKVGISGQYKDSRVPIYLEVINRFPEYVLTGVGMGNFYGSWGKNTKFHINEDITGVHNCLAQVTIFWGIIGLACYVFLIWRGFRSVRTCARRRGTFGLAIVGLSAAALMWSMFIHELERKEFSIVLGLLIAADRSDPVRKRNLVKQGRIKIIFNTPQRSKGLRSLQELRCSSVLKNNELGFSWMTREHLLKNG